MDLPALTAEEAAFLDDMRGWLAGVIADAGGALPFDRFMEAVLYAPGRGYYVNGRRKLGADGDFVTAPEISPLFGRCLAGQVAECLAHLPGAPVIEFGAGSGRMAADVLRELEALGQVPSRYLILEVSPSLRAMQRERLAEAVPHWLDRIEWLDRLPDSPVDAVVIGNELLDAMPVHRFRRQDGAWLELHVTCDGDVFGERWLPLVHAALGEALDVIWPDARDVSDGYASEINLRLRPWFAALAGSLARACVLLIDYGYTRREYYHPERDRGTLICHFRHRAHTDPYLLPGLQDLTANVDFTAVAEAAAAAGFALSGYTTQANFLLANGLDRRVADAMTGDDHARVRLLQGVKQLTLPSEMGERFKVIGFARGCEPQMTGFHLRDLRDRL